MQARAELVKPARPGKIRGAFAVMLLSAAIISSPVDLDAAPSRACLHYAEAKRLCVMKRNGMYTDYTPKYEEYSQHELSLLLSQDKIADYNYLTHARRALVKEGGENAVEACEKSVGLEREIKASEKKMDVLERTPTNKNKDLWKDLLRISGVVAFIYFIAQLFKFD